MAHAAGEFEPNDHMWTATGPLAPMPYKGTLETQQDDDWYWLQLAGQQQITFSGKFLNDQCSGSSTEATLRNQHGVELADFSDILRETGEVQEFHYTTPPSSEAFYVEVEAFSESEDNAGCEYEFSITPSTAYAPAGPAPPILSTAEPDNFKNSAHGPISGDLVYGGTIDDDNDVDQLYMKLKSNQRVTLELEPYRCTGAGGGGIEARLTPTGAELLENELSSNSVDYRDHMSFQSYGGNRIYVAIKGGAGCDWSFEASPAAAFITTPDVHADPCLIAKRVLSRRKNQLHHLQRKLRRAQSAVTRGRLHHKIEVRRRTIRASLHSARVQCLKPTRAELHAQRLDPS
jgi:hypothetical protein